MLHSYTSWSLFNQCPLKYKLQYIDGKREPPSKALLRGREVHDLLDGVLVNASAKGKEYPVEVAALHERTAMRLDDIIDSDDYVNERRVELQRDWTVGPAKWMVAKVDVSYAPREDVCCIVDWKTGRSPLAKYRLQGELYVAAAVAVWDRPYYSTCFLNVDTGETDGTVFTRQAARDLQPVWKDRFHAVEAETEFEPKVNEYCKWCFNAKANGGACPLA